MVDGAPDWKIKEDVLFFQLSEEGGADIMQMVDSVLVENEDDFTMHQGQTRVLKLSMIAYGSNSYKNLRKIRLSLLNGNQNIRNKKIYIIPSSDVPIYAPELFQSQWWPRTDLTLRFNSLIETDYKVNPIETVGVTLAANKVGNSSQVITREAVIIK